MERSKHRRFGGYIFNRVGMKSPFGCSLLVKKLLLNLNVGSILFFLHTSTLMIYGRTHLIVRFEETSDKVS